MTQQSNDNDEPSESSDGHSSSAKSNWREKYSARHRPRRVEEFPFGVEAPKQVRIYARHGHFMLQWWDRHEKRTLNERIDGDLVEAISRSRQIDEQLASRNSRGTKRNCTHEILVSKFVNDLTQRANAGEIDEATVRRYSSALAHHYLQFVSQPSVSRRYKRVVQIDREFQLEFAAYLGRIQVSPNGHPHATRRPLRAPGFVMDVVRSMLEWAADDERGALLPGSFSNPFSRRSRGVQKNSIDPIRSLDISVSMAVELISECDAWQLSVVSPLVLYGLRPGELGWLFGDNLQDGWLKVACHRDFHYVTKGRREKSFPIVDCLWALPFWSRVPCQGLLVRNRKAAEDSGGFAWYDADRMKLIKEYQRRCQTNAATDAKARRAVRNSLFKESGQLTYDQLSAEFQLLRSKLKWSRAATLKDLRHLFATCLEDAGVPEFYRRYFMGHSFGRAPIVTYTHVTREKAKEWYERVLGSELSPIVNAIKSRVEGLELPRADSSTGHFES